MKICKHQVIYALLVGLFWQAPGLAKEVKGSRPWEKNIPESKDDLLSKAWTAVERWLGPGDLAIYKDLGPTGGRGYPEVERALDGAPATVVRSNERDEVVIAVAVPIQRQRTVLGALLLSTQGGDIEQILAAERMAIVRVFLVAAVFVDVLTLVGHLFFVLNVAPFIVLGIRRRRRRVIIVTAIVALGAIALLTIALLTVALGAVALLSVTTIARRTLLWC